MLVAVGVVLAEFLAISLPPTANPVIRFSIGYLPIILAGAFFGPVYGGIAGAAQDLLGFFLFGAAKGYVFHPGYTLNAILYGVLPALFLRRSFRNEKRLFQILDYVAAAVLFGLAAWFFLDIDAVYSRTLGTTEKLLLAGFALVGAAGLALFNFLLRKKGASPHSPQKLLFVLIVMYVLTSLVLTPIWIWSVTPGYSIWLNIPLRLLKMPVETTFYVLLLTPLLSLYEKLAGGNSASEE
jgi:ECF transporter S component (folate family)